ncbi:hypothetical protein HZZ13_10345 [Bradyrhizobium sp. CNPSo 4010]|uniref:Uncharacterized protein n=1 Tax=Bradyrhizobium agreste TaxID=2751811 RepID=A0ABS0PLW2_9BRAD|nr:hypothetical protein [Bradyrhizobium agreste]MBH5398188.1 hypothetical protein [Bradyrhizobium agreste]
MTKNTFSGEIDRSGMTRIQVTLPGSRHHATAMTVTVRAKASLRIAQDQGQVTAWPVGLHRAAEP